MQNPPAVDPPGHGGPAPRGISVFISNKACLVPLPAVDAIEHGDQKSTPGRFPSLIGGLYDIQAILQFQSAALKLTEGCGHTVDKQKDHSCAYYLYNRAL